MGFSSAGVKKTSAVTSLFKSCFASVLFIFCISFTICFSRTLAAAASLISRRCCRCVKRKVTDAIWIIYAVIQSCAINLLLYIWNNMNLNLPCLETGNLGFHRELALRNFPGRSWWDLEQSEGRFPPERHPLQWSEWGKYKIIAKHMHTGEISLYLTRHNDVNTSPGNFWTICGCLQWWKWRHGPRRADSLDGSEGWRKSAKGKCNKP